MYNINKKEYFNFIDNKIFFTSCQKKYLKYLKSLIEKKDKIYVNIESNKQAYTFIYNAYKEDNFVKISKIILLLKKFISYDNSIKLINLIRQNKMLDTQIIELIKKKNSNKSSNREKYNVYPICSSWKYIFENIALNSSRLFQKNNMDIKNIKYLDIGCGNGYKTIQFTNLLGLKKENINGTDIKHWGPYNQEQTSYDFNFKFILEDGKLDYSNNSFDFITCFLMLHHVNDLQRLIMEIKRVLKPNGILLIIEHDAHVDYDKLMLDILHTFYGFLVDKDEKTITNPSYSQYFNWCEWDFIFDKNKFSFIQANYIYTHLEHDTRFDNIYYSYYLNSDLPAPPKLKDYYDESIKDYD